MPRLSFKPDSSFFSKIAMGAVGVQAASRDLESLGHKMAELENGATDTKIWKDVKRKRVRIPDLVCLRCGLRVECRAKSDRHLSMSHSPTDAERAWDFGLVDDDIVAFPICSSEANTWSSEKLADRQSYWHSRQRLSWYVYPYVNYLRVADMRAIPHSRSSTKGVTEGSETSITWDAILSTREGIVEKVDGVKIGVRRTSDGHLYTWPNRAGLPPVVEKGQTIHDRQIIASLLQPPDRGELECAGHLPDGHLMSLLTSPERTQRFTGVKLVRLRREPDYADTVSQVIRHRDEDLYVRLEGAAYLVSVCERSAHELLGAHLESADEQEQLEAVVALSEAATDESADLLSQILGDPHTPYFLRSAAAWALGRIGSDTATETLIQAFADVDRDIREEALDAVSSLEQPDLTLLLQGLSSTVPAVAAGSAEAMRRHRDLPRSAFEAVLDNVTTHPDSVWPVWLLGQLPHRNAFVKAAIADLQKSSPEAHYAISVLWSFVDSWIARHWELYPDAEADVHD